MREEAHILPRIEALESLVALLRGLAAAAAASDFLVIIRANNVNAAAGPVNTAIFFRNLTADRTATLPAAPMLGQTVIVKDEDGSLAAHNIIINGNGNTIDGGATYTMTLAVNGNRAAITLVYHGAGWSIV